MDLCVSSTPNAALRAAIVDSLRVSHERRAPRRCRVALSAPSYDADDIALAVQTLVDEWPTIGPAVADVEARLADYLGVRHAIMVASGGAANLLIALYLGSPYAPHERRLRPGDEVIVPAVGWSTTVTPFLAIGCVPVFADSEANGLNVDAASLARLVSPRTRAIVIVHCLGTACDLDQLTAFCGEHRLTLIEDSCEALGTRWRGRHVGTFGQLASFSFYFSHHVTAIEGGLIVTDDDSAATVLRSLRANGYPIHAGLRPDNAFAAGAHAVDGRAHFPFAGFNFKPTDFSAALLRGQIGRIEEYVATRNRIADGYLARFAPFLEWLALPTVDPRCRPSHMAFPMVVRTGAPLGRRELCRHLNERGIDTRPIIGGNIAAQPFMRGYEHRAAELARANQIHEDGFMIGVHARITEADVDHVASALGEVMDEARCGGRSR